ncbi:hypothetical protein GGR21_002907 [Dysgonomonas hofstadii]|uniref:Uncharacterized protein n=1 Tax=Dysgonomonas hofstadii TaxID=637886 RepID=A0A840CYI0_9BACT|nr:hypothetical protein [Dysgonomonas hofstadii]MBB4036993.1 hypothetical protein [Dysgonomonas hofstadii]
MIYEVKYTVRNEEDGTDEVKIFEIDDLVMFDDQPGEFKRLFNSREQCDMMEFDNATVITLSTNRVLITLKEE